MSPVVPLVAAWSPVLAVTESEPAGTSEIGIGAVVLTIAIAAVLVWIGYLVTSSRRKRRADETPKNLQPWLSDDELENKRLTRILSSAAISAAVLAIVLPVYYVNESGRQADATESFAHLYVEEGGRWFDKFECSSCHGPDGGGVTAEFIEPRSGLTVNWVVPSINDVLYRYSEDEVRFWVEFGRPGTPMPAQGLASGKGAMTVQEVDQVLAYLHTITLPQFEAFDKTEGAVSLALTRIATGAAAVARQVMEQRAVVDDIIDADMQLAVIADFPDRVEALLSGDLTCTDASAALVGNSCTFRGQDRDRDGLADAAERDLLRLFRADIDNTILIRSVVDDDGVFSTQKVQNTTDFPNLYGLELSEDNPFTMSDASGHPVADLDTVDAFLRDLRTARLKLSVVSGRIERFQSAAEEGLTFLETSLAAMSWEVDLAAVAKKMTGVATSGGPDATPLTESDAERAVGLFNAYCARCHTSGYSAGVAFEQAPGSGAWAPALSDGRAVTQFPSLDDHIDFIIRGSQLGENYGTNGLGRGWMPGFGQVLSAEDIRLIALYERTL